MKNTALFFSLAALAANPVLAADPATIDWSKIPAKSVKLFYPGQSSYEWLLTAEHKKGNKAVPSGRACLTCHEDDEANMGNKLVKAGPLEPTPLAGKPGTIDLAVQAAHDDKNLYLRFQWATQAKGPGDAYPHLRFDGKEWKPYGAQKLNKAVREGKMQAVYEDRLSLMIDDGKVKNFDKQGCWITCHNGMRDMPAEATKEQLAAHPLLQKRSDVRKYLPATRAENGAWDKTKSAEEIAKLKADGGFLDLIQWRAHRSNPIGMADDGYVLDWRNFDSGANPFASNMDGKTKTPRFMFKGADKAFSDANPPKNGGVLIAGQNAVPFDPNAGWKAGDLLPQYYLSAEAAKGSAADNKYAKGVWKDGTWTLVWARPLNLRNPDDKALQEGKSYSFGFAVHDDNITTRGHHVSFPVSVGFGAKGDIQATKLK